MKNHTCNCPKCDQNKNKKQAHITTEEGRYKINCTACGYTDYLKIASKHTLKGQTTII